MRLLEPSGIRADLGSFWYENVSKESQEKLRALLDAVVASTAYTSIHHQLHRIVDQDSPLNYENIAVVAKWREVYYNDETWWGAGIATSSTPLLLKEGGNDYVAGIDFIYEPNSQDILFSSRPSFDSFIISLGLADDAGPMLHSILYGLFMRTRVGEAELIANYLRGDQHPESLENALRAQLGMKRVKAGGTVLERKDLTTETVYVFDDEIVKVPYSHAKFPVGSVINPGVWFGTELVNLSIYEPNNTGWYRDRNDWSDNGLDLQNIVGYGLTATDTTETVEEIEGTPGFLLQEDVAGDHAKFWQRVQFASNTYGDLDQKYSEGSTVNPIDVFFQDFLDHAIILHLDARVLTPQAVIGTRNWFVRHCPFGYLPIVRVQTSTVEQNYSQFLPDITGLPDATGFYGSFGYLIYNTGFLTYNDFPLALSIELDPYPVGTYANDILGSDSSGLFYDGGSLIYI